MPVTVSRAEIWELLNDRAMNFQSWMDSGTPEANFVRTMFMTSENIALDSQFFQNQVLPLLLSLGVIDQGVMDRINARISVNSGDTGNSSNDNIPGMKHYKVPIPVDVSRPLEWISRFCNQDHYARVSNGCIYLDTTGTCIAPGVQEVTK